MTPNVCVFGIKLKKIAFKNMLKCVFGVLEIAFKKWQKVTKKAMHVFLRD